MGRCRGDVVAASNFLGLRGRSPIAAVLTIALAAMLAGCDGVETDYAIAKQRAEAYVAAHSDLPAEIAATIRANGVRKGMTKEQVIAAWGQPAVVQKFRDGAVEQWYFGCDWPNFCDVTNRMGPEPGDTYNSWALFENGVVVDWRT